jgi:hypothetical protein
VNLQETDFNNFAILFKSSGLNIPQEYVLSLQFLQKVIPGRRSQTKLKQHLHVSLQFLLKLICFTCIIITTILICYHIRESRSNDLNCDWIINCSK